MESLHMKKRYGFNKDACEIPVKRIMRKTVTLLHQIISFIPRRILVGHLSLQQILHTQVLIWINSQNLMTIFVVTKISYIKVIEFAEIRTLITSSFSGRSQTLS